MPCGKPNKQIISYISELWLLGGRDDIFPTLDESKDKLTLVIIVSLPTSGISASSKNLDLGFAKALYEFTYLDD